MSADKDDAIKIVVALALFGIGVFIVGWQIYGYLRYEIWNPVSIVTVLQWMKIGWALNPVDWVGLFNILKMMPLSVTMFVIGWLVVVSD